MISNDSIQKVREHADIVDIVSHFIALKKRGSNYIANCPFHNERTPSFNVNPSRGIYKCFGCGEAGDSIQFVQSYEKFSFIEAVRWIADFYHIELEETEISENTLQNKHKEESLRIVFEFAANYFQKNLLETETGRVIGLSYFKERGFTDEMIATFRLGYASDDWNEFGDYAVRNGFDKDILLESGLITEKNGKTYDTYRGRIIFPIISNTGKVVGLGGRILNNQVKAPKYINSNESPIYNKSKLLYGLFQSRQEIKNNDECILVEGYTDVISLHQNNIKNVVASSGTSLTEGQLKLIRNLTKNLIILYDGDAAGVKAAIRGMQLALRENFDIHVVLLPNNDDPDSYLKNHSREEFLFYLQNNKKDIIDFQIDVAYQQGELDTKAKTELTHELAETIAQIDVVNNFILKNEYVKKASQRLKIDEQAFLQLMNKYTIDKNKKEAKSYTAVPNEEEKQNVETSTSQAVPQYDINEWESQKEQSKFYRSVIEILLKYGNKDFKDGKKVHEYFYGKFDLDDVDVPIYKLILLLLQEEFSQQKSLDEITLKMIRHEDLSVRNTCIELLLEEVKPHPIWEQGKTVNPYLEQEEKEDTSYIDYCESVFYYYEFFQLERIIHNVQERLKANEGTFEDQLVLLKVLDDLKKSQKSLGTIVVKKG